MRLPDYLERRGEDQTAFAIRAGVGQKVVNKICRGLSSPSLRSAALIVKATKKRPAMGGGVVTYPELLRK